MSGTPEKSPASPFLMERLLREAYRREKTYEIDSSEGFLAEAEEDGLAAGRERSLADDPAEMAQEFAYQAYESEDGEQARGLVAKALALDAECVDALVVRAFLDSEDAGALIEALEHALTVGEAALGDEFFAEHMGDFWPLVQARPYLRAVKQLAEVLWHVGRRFDAVAHYEDLMDLDPKDHMGNASLLLGYYLAMGEVQRSWDLLEDIDEDDNTVSAWSWVLLFVLTGDEDAARDALDHALALNAHVAPLLVGLVDVPDEPVPAWFEAGSPEEAVSTLEVLGEAFARSGEVQLWVHNALVDMGLIEIDDEEPTTH